jgi:hypothetical protein
MARENTVEETPKRKPIDIMILITPDPFSISSNSFQKLSGYKVLNTIPTQGRMNSDKNRRESVFGIVKFLFQG